MPNASAPNAPWVEVCESPQTMIMPGLRVALLGTDHVHDALAGRAHGVERDAELLGVGGSACIWRALISSVTGPVGRGHVVVHRGDGEVGPADGAAVHAEASNACGLVDLVHEVQVDVEEVGLAVGAMDDVAFPDLLGQRLGHRCMRSWLLRVRAPAVRGPGWLPLFHYLELSSAIWNRCEEDSRWSVTPTIPTRTSVRHARDRPRRDRQARPSAPASRAAAPETAVGTLDRALDVLDAVEGGARSYTDIARATGLTRPTAHR